MVVEEVILLRCSDSKLQGEHMGFGHGRATHHETTVNDTAWIATRFH